MNRVLDVRLEDVLAGYRGCRHSESAVDAPYQREAGRPGRVPAAVFRGLLLSEELIIHLIIHSVYLLYSYYT